MRKIIYGAVILLAALHHDFWFWNDPTLVAGIMPIGLAYHLMFSVVSGLVWALAVVYCWPTGVEEEVKQALAEMENTPES